MSWRDLIGIQNERRHDAWLSNGRTGEGRIDVVNETLDGFKGRGNDWTGARFVGCTFVDFVLTYSRLTDVELRDCVFERVEFGSCHFDGGTLERCRGVNTTFPIGKFGNAKIDACDFSGCRFGRASFPGAKVKDTSFARTDLQDARLDDGEFVDCDFSDADLSKYDTVLKICTARNTRFIRCDLRRTNWTERWVIDAVFEEPKVAGIHGRAHIGGTLTVVRPDFSPAGDGSDIRDAGALRAAWA